MAALKKRNTGERTDGERIDDADVRCLELGVIGSWFQPDGQQVALGISKKKGRQSLSK